MAGGRSAQETCAPPRAEVGAAAVLEATRGDSTVSKDKLDERYEKKQERKRQREMIVSDSDAPIPDAPVERARTGGTPGRNDPCPCGSGKKFKKCCGRGK